MLKSICFCLLFLMSLHINAWQKGEMVFTATTLLEKAEEFMDMGEYDSALVYCDRAEDKASSYREVYIVRHKVYEEMDAKSSVKIENLKAAQKISLEDEELAYYLGQIYQRSSRFKEAIVAYGNAITYSKAHDGDETFRYFYYSGRGTCYLKSRKFQEAIPDFTRALELDPESTGALINRGFCFYSTKDKVKACKDWRAAGKLGNATASNYIGKYCR